MVGHAPEATGGTWSYSQLVAGAFPQHSGVTAPVSGRRSGHTGLYSPFVKLAVSIPDPVYEAADRLAQHRKVSRSELYATALELLLASESDTDVTSRLDLVYAAQPARDQTPAKQRVIAVRESW